jgi:hypothetical protein
MATVTTFIDNVPAPHVIGTGVMLVSNKIDFSATNASASDVIQCLRIPAKATVLKCWTNVETAEGGTATADLGDGADPNGYNDAIDLNATGSEFSITSTDAFNEGKTYASADTIDLTLDHNMDAAIVNVYAIISISDYDVS